MKAKGFLLLLMFVINDLWACDSLSLKKIDTTTVFVDPYIYPAFKNGGEVGLMKFIKENIHYPDECVTGSVVVEFTVDTLGNTKDVRVRRGITKRTDEEAIRIVKLMTFIPAKLGSKLVEIKMNIPIRFRPE